ncbi:SRPBCC family protein [Plantibacter sp. Mn2098]|uniref:SRPBCC family protein n=1 Tax=Plantibacter sp. Mn2098 TaxID=3395266 RepID=UPI003BE9AF41
MHDRGIYVETTIAAPIDRIWELTQNPDFHARWDIRFSSILLGERLPSGGQRFTYERTIPFHTIMGTGTSIAEASRPDGTRSSALRFTTPDPRSPIGTGHGYWRYLPVSSTVGPSARGSAHAEAATFTTFVTGFDYRPAWGAVVDRLIMRRVIGWMTAWSFDRLRIWAETGVEPERWPVASAFAFWETGRPRAARCRRIPQRGRALDDAPTTLDTLEHP